MPLRTIKGLCRFSIIFHFLMQFASSPARASSILRRQRVAVGGCACLRDIRATTLIDHSDACSTNAAFGSGLVLAFQVPPDGGTGQFRPGGGGELPLYLPLACVEVIAKQFHDN